MFIVTYHAIDDHRSPVATSAVQFALDLQQLRDAGFSFVSLDDCADWLDGNRSLPERSVAVTFDDGYRSVAESALPLLAEVRAPATIFVIAGRLGGDNAWPGQWASVPRMPLVDASLVREMAAAGIGIGVHSWSHPILRELDDQALHREVHEAGDHLEQVSGTAVRHFAYPYGIKGSRERLAVAQRYRTAVSASPALVDRRANLHDLPRLDAHDLRLAARLRLWDTGGLRPYLAVRRLLRRARYRALHINT